MTDTERQRGRLGPPLSSAAHILISSPLPPTHKGTVPPLSSHSPPQPPPPSALPQHSQSSHHPHTWTPRALSVVDRSLLDSARNLGSCTMVLAGRVEVA